MIERIGIVGAGVMGQGIAQLCAAHGLACILCDAVATQLERAVDAIREQLQRQAGKGAIAESEIGEILSRIDTTTSLADLAAADFVVEAVSEDEALKLELFRRLDAIVRPDVVLASNTSSIPITRIAAATGLPGRVIGMHFMNPAPVMQLVEVIRGEETGEAAFSATADLATRLGKELVVSRDRPGFIVNRILIPMINEAIRALHEGVASAEEIDKGMRLGANLPMGPLSLADLIGLDTVLAIANTLYAGFGDPRYAPCPLLVTMVGEGLLGRKSGQGFFPYPDR
ncbi:MAG: 3-hydroxybutyryl-CoA dehydrogenase [Geobacter sp.]|nr:3-hydroxybutyryl-CoA dehydrogenase [Geobacter sp.]